jgi:hypothetical protein
MHKVIEGATIRVKVNNHTGNYIKSYKGVRQGDPLSPILFNFVADSLARMVHKDQENCLINGLCDHITPSGIIILQYVDDTIMCIKNDLEKAMHLKLVLICMNLCGIENTILGRVKFL